MKLVGGRRVLTDEKQEPVWLAACTFAAAGLGCLISRAVYPYYLVYFTVWPVVALAVTVTAGPAGRAFRACLPAVVAVVVLSWVPSLLWNGMRLRESLICRRQLDHSHFVRQLRLAIPAGTEVVGNPLFLVMTREAGLNFTPLPWYAEQAPAPPRAWLLLSREELKRPKWSAAASMQGRLVVAEDDAFPGPGAFHLEYVIFGPAGSADRPETSSAAGPSSLARSVWPGIVGSDADLCACYRKPAIEFIEFARATSIPLARAISRPAAPVGHNEARLFPITEPNEMVGVNRMVVHCNSAVPQSSGTRRRIIVLAAMCAWIWSPEVRATDHWVGPKGRDSRGQSTKARPWVTLQYAADRAGPGDTVHVLDGDYVGFDLRHGGTAGALISFKAEGKRVRIVRRNRQTPDGINVEGASDVVIDGFIVNEMPRTGVRCRRLAHNDPRYPRRS